MTLEKDGGFAAPRIQWPPDESGQREVAHQAGQILRHGGLVVYPTDTVYGIGADPLNALAVERIYGAKVRPGEKAIIWLIDKLERVADTCLISSAARALAAAFWPGALTLVLPLQQPHSEVLLTQAVRMPNHPAALGIIAAAGGAVATTSANRSGAPAARNAEEASEALGQHVDLIVDAGTSPGGRESTVLDLSVAPATILRAGPVTAADIERVIGATIERPS